MPTNTKVIGSRLSSMRQLLSYSEDDVARATGIEAERLLDLERGQSTPTGDEILILAALYECDFRALVDEALPSPSERTDILFRRYGDALSSADKRAIQEFVLLCQIENTFENLLSIPKTSFKYVPTGTHRKTQGQMGAQALRRLFGYEKKEVAPRDIYEDFRAIGIHIFRRRLKNDDVSGLYIFDPNAGHCVLINYNEDVYRQRFSVAHEVAHAIFDSGDDAVLTYVPSSRRYDANDLREIRANSFASQYLMPVEMLRRLPKVDATSAARWAQEFRVSTAALAKALRDARLVNADESNAIRAVRINSETKIDPEAPTSLTDLQRSRRLALLERGLSDYFVNLCFEAHNRDLISTGRLVEALRIDRAELRDIATLFGRRIAHGI
jgi:Zn-dependent peptidase ImmA (M78 family)